MLWCLKSNVFIGPDFLLMVFVAFYCLVFLIKSFFPLYLKYKYKTKHHGTCFTWVVVFVLLYDIQEALVRSVPKFWLLLILSSSFILVLSAGFYVKFEMYPDSYSKIAL